MKWFQLLGAAWLLLITASIINSNLPASWWFEPDRLHISNATMGECPSIEYDRTINRPFSGEWIAALQRSRSDGTFIKYRSYSGENDYRPDNGLPDQVDRSLAWFLETDTCQWPAGRYRVTAQWTIYPDIGGPRVKRITSSPFEVTP